MCTQGDSTDEDEGEEEPEAEGQSDGGGGPGGADGPGGAGEISAVPGAGAKAAANGSLATLATVARASAKLKKGGKRRKRLAMTMQLKQGQEAWQIKTKAKVAIGRVTTPPPCPQLLWHRFDRSDHTIAVGSFA